MDHEKYQISIERDGMMVPVGSISGESYRTATFSYIEEYLDDRNAGYMRRMFEILRQYSSNPIADQQRLWDMIVFCYLLGNTDAHIKNFSLLYGKDLRSIRLAPAYDMVSTTVYESSTREMAFSIGSTISIDDITENSFIEASEEVHLGKRFAVGRYHYICNHFREALRDAAAELSEAGFSKAKEMEDRILRAGGYARL